MPTSHSHQQQTLVNQNHLQSISPTSLSLTYGNQQQQQVNVLQTRYQNEQINEKTSHMPNGQQQQQQSMTNNAAALTAATNYRRNFNACAKPPYRYDHIDFDSIELEFF